MRETCVRVLAAALMTAAIAMVVGMSALFKPAHEADGLIAAPLPSLQTTVRLTAQVKPPRRQSRPRIARLVARDTIAARPRHAAAVTRRLVVVHKRQVRRPAPARQLAATTTTTVTTTTTATPPPAAGPVPVPAPAPQAQSADAGPPNDHGRGHAYGRSKQDD